MDFSRRKILAESKDLLFRIATVEVRPYTLMFSPVYVFLKANEKFLSVKAPLDFFTPEELTRLGKYESFYLPTGASALIPFRDAGVQIRTILEKDFKLTSASDTPHLVLVPQYELSNQVLAILGKLWWRQPSGDLGVEPFLVAALIHEICDPLPVELLVSSREVDAVQHERAILESSWVVFLAMHLGFCNLELLNRLRASIFEVSLGSALESFGSELDEVIAVGRSTIGETAKDRIYALIEGSIFGERPERVSHRMTSRLKRILRELVSTGDNRPTVYGQGGFLEA